MATILGTLPRYKRYVKHVNFQRLLVSSRLNLRPINHKERYFISWQQFHSTSNIFCQQWNNIIHHLRNASTHHVLRFFSIHKRYHRLDLTRGNKPDAVGKWKLKTTNQGWSLKTLSQAYLEPCQTSKTEFFLQKQLTANFAKRYLLDDGQGSEYACLWIINIPKLPQVKMRGK